jgi:hypothetical protein
MESNILLERACCKANPDSNQLSMLKGTWPTVVDHMHRIRAAWKNSIGCGEVRRATES